MAFPETFARLMRLHLTLGMLVLSGQSVQAEDAKPVFGARGVSIDYSVAGGKTIEERLAIKRKIFGIFSVGLVVSRENAGGLNICATTDNNVGYAFFKDIAYRLDLHQNTIKQVSPTNINEKLFFQVRFEMTKPKANEPLGDVLVLEAPNTRLGPPNPCSLY